jgi:large subunit ribosomal protein L3
VANSSVGLLGKKLGMTQLFTEDGALVGVTVVDASNNTVITVKSESGSDGYNAVQLGYGTRRASRITKASQGHFAKVGALPSQTLREVRINAADAALYPAGTVLQVAQFFNAGDIIDVVGLSKGRGFAGVFKRHHMAGFERSHGVHEYYRHGGSIGTRLTPGMTLKGVKMPGHLGNSQVTVQNLKIVKVDAEKGHIYIKGGVPGSDGDMVTVRRAVKKLKK